jgi:hypothetical protein
MLLFNVSFVLWKRQGVSLGMETCKEGNTEGVVGIYHCLTRDGLMINRLDRHAVGKKGWQFSLIVSLRLFRSSYARFWFLFVDDGPSMEYGCKDKVVSVVW